MIIHGIKISIRFLLRLLLLLALAGVFLFLAGTVAVRMLFTPADLKALALNQLQEAFIRPVSIESASFSYGGDIHIKGLKVFRSPNHGEGIFIKADHIYASYSPRALLRNAIELRRLVLVSPEINVRRLPDGGWNFTDILYAYAQKGRSSRALAIQDAEIKDGVLKVFAPDGKQTNSAEKVNISFRDFSPSEPFPLSLSAAFRIDEAGRPADGGFHADGVMDLAGFDLEKASFSGLSLNLTLGPQSFAFTGSVRDFKAPKAELSGDLSALSSRDFPWLAGLPHRINLPPSAWTLKGALAGGGFKFEALMASLGLRLRGDVSFLPGGPEYTVTASAPPTEISQLHRVVTGLPLGDFSGSLQFTTAFTNRGGRHRLSRAFVSATRSRFSYRGVAFSGTDASLLLREGWDGSYFRIARGQARLGPYRFSGIKLNSSLDSRLFTGSFSGELNGKPVNLRVSAAAPLSPSRRLEIKGYSGELDSAFIGALTAVFDDPAAGGKPGPGREEERGGWMRHLRAAAPSGMGALSALYRAGRVNTPYIGAADLKLSADMKNITGGIRNLKGRLALQTGAGTFYQVQKNAEKDRVYYIISMPILIIYKMNRVGALRFGTTLKDISFRSTGGEYGFDSGKLLIDNFYIDGTEFSAYVAGQMDLVHETMDLKVYTISDKYHSMGGMPETMTDASGKPALAFSVTGNANDPKIRAMNPRESGNIIDAAIKRGAGLDPAKFAGLER
ncbi:MAG TPA: AsmA-like C-terminal region-containing protein [Elusimicrobiales bacterium]|nr:AsmA-like C-terminal region-containing protein [Elusimicrobiales bacterium]